MGVALVAAMFVFAGCGGESADAPAEGGEPKVEEAAAAVQEAAETAMEAAAPEATEEAAAPAETSAGAGVHGRVAFDGPRPERSVIETDRSDPKCSILHGGEQVLSELRVVSEDGGVQHAFVYVKNAPEGDYPAPSEPAVLDQVGCMYVPHILGMRAGQTLNVQNSEHHCSHST